MQKIQNLNDTFPSLPGTTATVLGELQLFAATWTVYGVSGGKRRTSAQFDADGPADRHLSNVSACADSNPANFGCVDYCLHRIYVAMDVASDVRRSALLHELGHLIGWGTGRGDSTEADANMFATILDVMFKALPWLEPAPEPVATPTPSALIEMGGSR